MIVELARGEPRIEAPRWPEIARGEATEAPTANQPTRPKPRLFPLSTLLVLSLVLPPLRSRSKSPLLHFITEIRLRSSSLGPPMLIFWFFVFQISSFTSLSGSAWDVSTCFLVAFEEETMPKRRGTARTRLNMAEAAFVGAPGGNAISHSILPYEIQDRKIDTETRSARVCNAFSSYGWDFDLLFPFPPAILPLYSLEMHRIYPFFRLQNAFYRFHSHRTRNDSIVRSNTDDDHFSPLIVLTFSTFSSLDDCV